VIKNIITILAPLSWRFASVLSPQSRARIEERHQISPVYFVKRSLMGQKKAVIILRRFAGDIYKKPPLPGPLLHATAWKRGRKCTRSGSGD
jgi:hypothetical protein